MILDYTRDAPRKLVNGTRNISESGRQVPYTYKTQWTISWHSCVAEFKSNQTKSIFKKKK